MKASEFRIGNLVSYNKEIISFNEIKAIKAIHEHGADTGYRKLLEYDKLFPIPLTEKWLEDLGLTITNGFTENGDEIMIIKSVYFHVFCSKVGLKYVHQLQNLYFDLTGEELILNT